MNSHYMRDLFALTSRRRTHDDMEVPSSGRVWEDLRQLVHGQQRTFIAEGAITEVLSEASVDEDWNFPENEGVCIDVLEGMALFLLDKLSEVADSVAFCNLDWEDMTGIITEHQTVESELWLRN